MHLEMRLLATLYLCVTIAVLVPKFADGQQKGEEDWIKWQSWYLGYTAVSMNVHRAQQANFTGKGVLVAVVDDGVNGRHPDLASNFNPYASYDLLRDRQTYTDSHGTKCAGIIAGGNNTRCGIGVAFDAQISSIRLYTEKNPSTDELEAKALSFKRDLIDIYSNSWGPGDMAFEVNGVGPKLKKALEDGTRLGRGGKGSIFVFAAGNGGVVGDSCAYSGYVNSIHTIAISGVNWDGFVPAYTEECAAIMAVTYGQDMFRYNKFRPPLVTVNGDSECTDRFPGTSGTAAIASGIIALALEANPKLTWRDVQHLIVRTSKPLAPPNGYRSASLSKPTWTINAAGLKVSKDLGFGLIDAVSMTEYAKQWKAVPRQLVCEVELNISSFVIPQRGNLNLTLSLKQDNCGIRYLEHMQAEVNLRFQRRGDLEMVSTSPNGTQSKLLYSRALDSLAGYKNFTNWRVTSLHYWGESPIGDWNVLIYNTKPWRNRQAGRLFGLKLILYGTRGDPLKHNKHVDAETKETEEVSISSREKEIPVHGGYSRWSYWSWCSRRCGSGTQNRYRSCTNPRPENGGRDCSGLGPEKQTRFCNTQRCPVHGGYSLWSRWSTCSKLCGGGTQRRSRSCTRPRPRNGGRDCSRLGPGTQSRTCNPHNCTGIPIQGGYSKWSLWGSCSKTCGGGTQQRSRSCTNPRPSNGGRNCSSQGLRTELRTCNTKQCTACKNRATDDLCQYYFGIGSCSNPSVQKMCKKTCGLCQNFTIGRNSSACKNRATDDLCQYYFNFGSCSNPSVQKMCKKTCGLCPVCKNMSTDKLCQQYFDFGSCSNISVTKMCKKTCGLCRV